MHYGISGFGCTTVFKDNDFQVFYRVWIVGSSGFGSLVLQGLDLWSFRMQDLSVFIGSDRFVVVADTKVEKICAGMKFFRLRGDFARRKCKMPDERNPTNVIRRRAGGFLKR
jgi:hypothetical protein